MAEEKRSGLEQTNRLVEYLVDDVWDMTKHEVPDLVLSALCKMADHGLEIPITLIVGGSSIAGRLVGGKEYFQGVAKVARAQGMGELAINLEMFEQLYAGPEVPPSDSDIPQSSSRTTKDRTRHLATFIHLKDARVLAPTGEGASEGSWWRGRLSAVAGFAIGTPKQPSR